MPSAWISSGWYLPTDRKPAVKEEKSRRKEVDEPEPKARSLCSSLEKRKGPETADKCDDFDLPASRFQTPWNVKSGVSVKAG